MPCSPSSQSLQPVCCALTVTVRRDVSVQGRLMDALARLKIPKSDHEGALRVYNSVESILCTMACSEAVVWAPKFGAALTGEQFCQPHSTTVIRAVCLDNWESHRHMCATTADLSVHDSRQQPTATTEAAKTRPMLHASEKCMCTCPVTPAWLCMSALPCICIDSGVVMPLAS